MFPPELAGTSHVNGTQIFIYKNDIDAMTINKAAIASSLFTGAAWVGTANANTILRPETQFILRSPASSSLTVLLRGDSPDHTVSGLVAPSGDLVMGSGYPKAVVLKKSGLDGNSRQAFFYNNTTAGINK